MYPTQPSWLKVFALPVAVGKRKAKAPLVYFHAKKVQPDIRVSYEKDMSLIQKYTNQAIDRSSKLWSGFGDKKEGSWQRKLYTLGTKYMDKIDYEEWSLKAIDPSLSPKPWDRLIAGEEKQEKVSDVTLYYPPSQLKKDSAVKVLKELVDQREPLHRQAMMKCLLLSPLTFPFTVLPVIPNIPFFYVMWRAWSHWRAYKASQYLKRIIEDDHLTPVASEELDLIYERDGSLVTLTPAQLEEPPARYGTSKSKEVVEHVSLNPVSDDNSILLTPERIEKISDLFHLDKSESEELERAMKQSTIRIHKKST